MVYGAKLRVTDGATRRRGTVLLEWDPYTFSILTEEAGVVKFKDIIDGVTVHEEVDEVTGLSRRIIIDRPTTRSSRWSRSGPPTGARCCASTTCRSHAHLMVDDGEAVYAGRRARQDSARDDQDQGHHRRSAARGRAVRGAQAEATGGGHREIDGMVEFGAAPKGKRKVTIVPDEAGNASEEYLIPRGVHINVQEGERVQAGDPLMDGPRNPHDILRCSATRNCRSTWSTRSRRSTGCRA